MKCTIDGVEVLIESDCVKFKIDEKEFSKKVNREMIDKNNIAFHLLSLARNIIMEKRGITHPIKKEDFFEIQRRFEPIKINE